VGRGYVLTSSNSVELGRKKKTISSGLMIGPNVIKLVTLAIIAVLAVVYLSQSTSGAGRSVKIRDIENEKGELMLEKERLETEQTRLKALKEIDNGIEKQVMEPVSSVKHMEENNSLAKNN